MKYIGADYAKEFSYIKEDDIDRISQYAQDYLYDLLDMAVDKRDQQVLQILISNKFLTGLQSLVTYHQIDLESDIRINYRKRFYRVAYDYYDYKNYGRLDDNNLFTQNIIIDIAYNLDQKKILPLIGLGLSKDESVLLWIAVDAYSSESRDCYKRLIRMIQSMSPNKMTEQMIINICEKIANDSVTDLFIAMMNDPLNQFANSDEEYVYSTLSLAVLDIVESLPMNGIYKVLHSYLGSASKRGRRFQLKSINISDYPRINEIIDILESQGYNII